MVQPFEVTDFSGGITDDIYQQDYKKCAELNNFTLGSDGKPISRPGSEIENINFPQIPVGNQRIGTLINYNNNDTLFVHSARHVYYRNPASFSSVLGPTGNPVFSVGNVSHVVSQSQWAKQIFLTSDAFPNPQKIFKNDLGQVQVRPLGLPKLATNPVGTGTAGTLTYIYAFYRSLKYKVFSQEFEDIGPVTYVELENIDAPNVNPVSFTGIAALVNGSTDNYDLTNTTVQIYRTLANGDTFFRIGEVSNGTTVFNDNQSDTSIEDNTLLYTDDDTVDFEPAPLSKFLHIVNNTGYYGFIKVGTQEFPTKVIQSIPLVPGSVNSSFEVDLEDDIQGVSSAKSVPIVLCKKFIYRLEGGFDQFGRGGINPVRISDTAGCVSAQSIVQAENGIFWAGNDGFYFADGYQVQKISDGNNNRYKALLEAQTQDTRIYGKFDEKERRIYWAIQKDSASLDNDSLAVLDLRFGVRPDAVFTTWSGPTFRPTALEFFQGNLYRADRRGYVLVHRDQLFSDPKIDPTVNVNLWSTEAIVWLLRTVHINFGSTFNRKMPSRVLLTAANLANTTVQINCINDDGRLRRALKVIRWRRNFVWGDPDFIWGNPDCVWNATGLIEQYRRFPARGLRLSYMQLEITNGVGVITNSDTIGNATFNTATKQIVLDSFATQDWPSDVVDYTISTEVDGYVREFVISQRNSNDMLTVLDPSNALPTGSFKWVIKGLRKGEPLHLLSYNVFWQETGQSQATFETGQDGANA